MSDYYRRKHHHCTCGRHHRRHESLDDFRHDKYKDHCSHDHHRHDHLDSHHDHCDKDKHHDDCICDKHKNCKDDCLCRLLEKFKGAEATIKTKSGDFIEGEIESISKDCCIAIIEPEILTPPIGRRVTFVRCKDVESFSIDFFDASVRNG